MTKMMYEQIYIVFINDFSSYKLYRIMLSEADRFLTIYADVVLYVCLQVMILVTSDGREHW